MPLYEYKCRKCKHITERIVKSIKQDKYICEKCGYTSDRILSVGIFKVNGYSEANGYSNKGE